MIRSVESCRHECLSTKHRPHPFGSHPAPRSLCRARAGATSVLSFANFSSALVAPPGKKAAGAADRFKLTPRVLDHSKEALSTSEEARDKVKNESVFIHRHACIFRA